ncbi:AmmeMemoRadiSam system protein A [Levilinea saccharolytica]|uniref:AMMECR1 domain-containing protein n=1 Tax=Levilinea saccharolytica TaxID=229921 RepID=A0A0P6XL11_9CHLR|nr:AmmeMemoRadiSam system protein A [Levilinea saccharolytica]KPL75776.1 hypothetical protein ADN01_18345 [Levilinea saccharolytica]GAP17457.1 uncharacterized protein, PH0010 family [Levilinea saccharolytica]
MTSTTLTLDERRTLLRLARETVARTARRQTVNVRVEDYSPALQAWGASFVTLTTADGDLRGCIGALEAYQPLVQDVCEHAAAAASEDYRFYPVRPEEVDSLHIEISILTAPQILEYSDGADLAARLRPGVDGVILWDGGRRATFLPQVWEKLPDPEEFLAHLCMKMGAPADTWRRRKLRVGVYQVEEFHEGQI